MITLNRAITLTILWSLGPFLYPQELPLVEKMESQPLLAQVTRLTEALSFLGSGLQREDLDRLQELKQRAPSVNVVLEIQRILDPYCLAMVQINPEARVMVRRGPSPTELVQNGWKSFLVKVHNLATINSELIVESPNAAPLLHKSTAAHRVAKSNMLSPGQIANRFLEVDIYRRRPISQNLSGLRLEYAIVQIYTRESGPREAKIGFHVGQGTQDIGFRNAIDILFDCQPAVKVRLRILDDDGSPTMASLTITDEVERFVDDPEIQSSPQDYRVGLARNEPWDRIRRKSKLSSAPKRLVGIYPLPSRRLARDDLYPDFFFHAQIYRSDQEHVNLPPGNYQVRYSRGPEYLTQKLLLTVPEGVSEYELSLQLKRWTHLAKLGWYSADHHIHAAGCSHYENPEEGVRPEHMWRQVLGEDLNVACVLTWGPGWYHQKQFFEGDVNSLSNDENIIRYDVEVSGFPSSHAGHLVLLRLKEDDYPGTNLIEDWPSWTSPILKWAKTQGGVTGYAHSGWGLEPETPTDKLPNYVLPKFDGIGANEYIVTATQGTVDFISAGDTPSIWELNIWYHTLNTGFRTRISGETDFPCIYDDRVGMARTYAHLNGKLDFNTYMDRLREGRSYVSDGRSHLIDFAINRLGVGTQGSEINLTTAQNVKITAKVAAYLPETPGEIARFIAARELTQPPYWHLERARIGETQKVPVELIVNGQAVAQTEIQANGSWVDLDFDHTIERSSWIALRILPSSHTNPIFVLVDEKPVRVSKRSGEWCRRAVDKCWDMKKDKIRLEERKTARSAYQKARQIYDQIILESYAN